MFENNHRRKKNEAVVRPSKEQEKREKSVGLNVNSNEEDDKTTPLLNSHESKADRA